MENIFDIDGMHWASYSSNIELNFAKMQNVKKVDVSLSANTMSLSYDDSRIIGEDIDTIVQALGYSTKHNLSRLGYSIYLGSQQSKTTFIIDFSILEVN